MSRISTIYAPPKAGRALRKLIAVLCAWLACVSVGLAQRTGEFRILGPGGGGAMFHPTISPHDPRTVLVSCDMSGGYITHDGGQSWRLFNLRGALRGFVFDPLDAKVIYALGIGLWRSSDAGETWRLLAPDPATVVGVENASDEAEQTLLTRGADSRHSFPFTPPSAFAVDPLDSKHLLLAAGYRLWESKDRGLHWEPRSGLPAQATSVAMVRMEGTRAGLVIVATVNGFGVSDQDAPVKLSMPAGVARLDSAWLDAIGGKLLAVAVGGGKLYNAWVDKYWVDASAPGTQIPWSVAQPVGDRAAITLAASGHDGRTLYASFRNLRMDGTTWLGIARSEDLGQHWTLVLKDAGKGSPNIADGWMSAALGSGWGEQPLGLDVARSDPRLIYATDLGRTIKSSDGGAHWMGVYSRSVPGGGAVSTGLDVLTSYGVHFDPFDPKRLFVAYTDVGLMRSEDGGQSWRSSVEGVPFAWKNTTYSMVFDPAVRGRAWAVMTHNHDLPRARMLRRDVAQFCGGVVSSEDGGVHWKVAGSGMPETAPTDILLDPRSNTKARTLYAATMGRGVFKSVDGGRSWTAKNDGIAQAQPLAFKLKLASDGNLFVVIARQSADGSIGNAGDGALYRSRNGAESWERVALPEGVNGPTGVYVDPREPWKMYLSAWARNTGQRGAGGGVYGSADAGAHWVVLLDQDRHVSDVSANPENLNEMYAVGFESSAWHSTDRGAHWQRIAGYNFHAGLRVTPQPGRAGFVYINTFGGGVWYGRVDGKTGVEDIATKQLMP